MVLIFLQVGFEALSPWPIKVLVDNVLGSEIADPNTFQGKLLLLFTSKESLGFFVVLVYSLSTMLENLMEYLVSSKTKKLGMTVINDFSQDAFDNLEKLSVGYYKNKEIGDYVYRLSYDVSALGTFLEFGVIPIVTNFVYLIGMALVMLWINVQLGIIALSTIPVLALGMAIFNQRIGLVSRMSERSNSALFSFVEQILTQLRIVQSFNQEKKESVRFKKKESDSLEKERSLFGLDYLSDLMLGLIIAIGYSLVIVYGIHSVSVGAISTGLLVIFIFYMDNLTYPMITLVNSAASLREDYTKIKRLQEFFDKKFQTKDTGTLTAINHPSIKFKNVSLRATDGNLVLKNVSFEIPAGKKTVIVGVNGSGKSTLISLIIRFLEPNRGKVEVGGRNIFDYSLKEYRDSIAYVPQEIVLFDDTIRNNISFGRESTLQQIKEAICLASADKFIKRLGYDFVVGEAGMNLSGGQRQRVMLARAFLKKDAKILIFDEPLSALDVKTRAEIIKNINEFAKGKTAIIVTNILEIIKEADYVIMINEGKIVHAGSNKKLLAEAGIASLLVNT